MWNLIKKFFSHEEKYLINLFNNLKAKNIVFEREINENKRNEIKDFANIFSELSLKEREYITINLNNHLNNCEEGELDNSPESKINFAYKLEESNYYDKINLLNGVKTDMNAPKNTEEKDNAPKEVKEEKKIFNIQLTSFDAKSKMSIIKEIKTKFGLGLKDSKELVDKAPSIIKEKVNKKDAEEIQAKFESLGCKITLM